LGVKRGNGVRKISVRTYCEIKACSQKGTGFFVLEINKFGGAKKDREREKIEPSPEKKTEKTLYTNLNSREGVHESTKSICRS